MGRPRRGQILVTTFRALRLLRGGWISAPAIADELGIHVRTVYRLVAALEAAGIRVERRHEGRDAYLHVRATALRRALRM